MRLALDLGVCLVMFLSIWYFSRNGFIMVVYHALGWMLCLLLVYLLQPYAARFLQEKGVTQLIADKIEGVFAAKIQKSVSESQESVEEALLLPQKLQALLKFNNNETAYELLGVSTAVAYLAMSVAQFAVNLLAVILLLIVLRILFLIVGILLKLTSELPVIHGVNAFLGGVGGFFLGILFVWIYGVVVYCVSIWSSNPGLLQAAGEAFLLSKANLYNPILNFAVRLIK